MDAATKEPIFPKIFVESTTKTEAPWAGVEVEIFLDKGKGEDKRGKKEQELEKKLYLLQLELSKWKYRTILMEKGMISLSEHRRIIQELKDKWAEELSQWDNFQKGLQEWEILSS